MGGAWVHSENVKKAVPERRQRGSDETVYAYASCRWKSSPRGPWVSGGNPRNPNPPNHPGCAQNARVAAASTLGFVSTVLSAAKQPSLTPKTSSSSRQA